MKRSAFGFLLAALLVLTGFGAARAQDAPPAPADEPSLRMPRYIAPAYTTLGTHNADGTSGPNYWQNHSVHDIAIEVAPPGRTVTGTQTITYTNNSPNPLPFVVVRLYQNARLPEAIREENVTPDFLTDGIQIDEFSVNGQVMPWATFDSLLPYETVKMVPLAQPLMPGESAVFSFKWHYDLGLQYKREGVFDPTTFFIAYFFPRIATYSDTDVSINLLPGWDFEEYTYVAGRELNNDFADFNFSVTVPKNFLVWATGELQNPDEVLQPDAAARLLEARTSDEIIPVATVDDLQQGLVTAQTDAVTWRWQAENVSDVAIGLSDHYAWDASSVVVDPTSDRRVSVNAAYSPDFAGWDQMTQDIKDIVTFASSEWPGVPYPYSHANVFVGGGDEEFPMLANDDAEVTIEGASVRIVAAHELLHNYFPFYMGIDERRYPAMDEGWTTAFEYLFNLEDIGQEAADALFIKMRSGNLVRPYIGEAIPMIMPADATRGYATGRDSYEKAALTYLALREYMGDEAFKSSLHAFIDRWHGKRPLPWDMFNTFDDTSDLELNWFFKNWFFDTHYMDIAIADVQTTDDGYAIQVTNVGGAAIPFDVKVVYADDSEESFRQGPGVWKDSPEAVTVTIPTDQEVKSVALDGGIFIDSNMADNVWMNEATTAAESATATPAPPPTEELVQLRATPWQWVAFTSPMEQFDVEAPLSYLAQFNDDGTVNVVADCNNAVGSYQGEGGKLEIQIGPMTAAACPPDSRSDQFVRLLGGAALYFFQDGNLHIDLFADSGTMVFSPAPPDIFGDDGGGAVADLPDTLAATLGNLSYSGLFDDREVTLVDGAFKDDGDAGAIAIQLLDQFIALGDLNGDGAQDAVALLEFDTSGSGRFTFAAPVLDVLNTPSVGSALMVEDRIQPTALTITDGEVIFEYIGHGEGDGECCPSWNIRHTFAWQDGALVEVSREEVSKVAAD